MCDRMVSGYGALECGEMRSFCTVQLVSRVASLKTLASCRRASKCCVVFNMSEKHRGTSCKELHNSTAAKGPCHARVCGTCAGIESFGHGHDPAW